MGQILAIVSSKGGVGKTTTAVNLAAAFASLDFPTLLIEADPQCSLVANFGFDRFEVPKGLAEVARGDVRLEETTFETPVEGLHVVSSNVWSQEEEIEYMKALDKDPLTLKRATATLRDSYDYIVFDAPPMLGPITMAVLAAADRFVVPLQTETHAIRSMSRLMEAVALVRKLYNPGLKFDGVALTMVDSRTKLSTENAALVRAAYPDQVFSATIPRSVRLAEIPSTGRPVAVSAPSSRSGRAYASLAEEILRSHAHERAAERSLDLDDDATDLTTLEDHSEGKPGRTETRAEDSRAIAVEPADNGAALSVGLPADPEAEWDEEGKDRFIDLETYLEMEESGAKSRTAVADDEEWSDN